MYGRHLGLWFMGGGGFPIDILLFGMVAAFLVLRLRSILGRKTGFERPPGEAGPDVLAPGLPRTAAIPGADRADAGPPPRALPDPASPAGLALQQMHAISPQFDPQHFLAGAEGAFRMIVGAYAAGDRVALRPLLTDDIYRAFEGAITQREANGETQRSEIRSIETVAIEEAALNGAQAAITVRFVSDQIAETLDKTGKPVAGTDAVTELVDLWTFERDLRDADPAWRLSAARSG